MDNKIIVLNSNEFFEKQKQLIQLSIREEIQKISPKEEEILIIEDVCKLLKKTKQTIYNWMDSEKIKAHYLNGSLFFLRSEIMASIKEKG